MKTSIERIHSAPWAWLPVVFLACAGCRPMSEQVEDPTVGRNGGFEHTRSGLPVNWIVYSPATLPSGSYELLFDREDFEEGEQSLVFVVEECSPAGGWRSPGITQEYAAETGTTYAIRFWIKSAGCHWTVSYGGVTAKTGAYETVDSSEVAATSWQHVEREYAMPEGFDRLRFELSIRSPGTLWIDDVRIEAIDPADQG